MTVLMIPATASTTTTATTTMLLLLLATTRVDNSYSADDDTLCLQTGAGKDAPFIHGTLNVHRMRHAFLRMSYLFTECGMRL